MTAAPRTIAVLAAEALAVQDACNLSGVAHGFARAMSDLLAHGLGTDAANRHPVAILWADKIAHLTGTQQAATDEVRDAYRWAFDASAIGSDRGAMGGVRA